MPHKDQKYIKALCNNDAVLIEEIYQKCSANCETFVKKNSGSEIDAADVFQEAIIEVYLKCEEIILSASICAYLGTIYRRKWINKLNRQKNFVRILKDIGYIGETSNTVELESVDAKMETIVNECFKKLSRKCQDVLNLYINDMTGQEIADKLDIKRNNVFKQKFDCLDRLKTFCEQHPDFKDLNQ